MYLEVEEQRMANSGYMIDMKIVMEVGEGKLAVFGMAVEAGGQRVVYLVD